MGLLTCHQVTRNFYGVHALLGVDLAVEPRRITGLIGPNGAGKTTLFNCISGLVPANSGRIVFDGHDITRWRPDRISGIGVIRTFQIARGIPRLSVLENLLLYGAHQPGESLGVALVRTQAMLERETALYARARSIAERLNLKRVLDTPAAALSGGQKKLLEIGRALMAEPRMLLLDEPVAGVNPTLANEIGEHLRGLVTEGVTILLIEHQMDAISRLCDHVVVMAEGRRLVEGAFTEIAANPLVQEAYMGRRRWAS
jgi:ABC-type branched-subunit amino acid transport system ATPase component